MIEGPQPGEVEKDSDDCTDDNSIEIVDENLIANYKVLIDNFITNYHLPCRAFKQCVWGVRKEMLDAQNKEKMF